MALSTRLATHLATRLATAALLAGACTFGFAQSESKPAMPEAAMGHHGMGHHGFGQDPAKMQAFVAKRLASLKATLKIAPEQEAAWTSFATALTPQGRPEGMARPDRAEIEKMTTPERIDKMRAMRDQRHALMMTRMQQREEATKTFYATLNAEQKKTFDDASLKMLRQGMAAHGHGK